MRKPLWGAGAALAGVLLGAGGYHYVVVTRVFSSPGSITDLPSTTVKRGTVSFIVHAKGELQGSNTESIMAPMIGGGMLAITDMRETGELVKPGEVVVEFSKVEQEFKLREAEADAAEAEQKVVQAQAEADARQEEVRLALAQARSDARIAKLETRKNPVKPAMVAEQNDLALQAANDKVAQLERDLDARLATAQAGVAIEKAAREKARVAAGTARGNIDSMTVKAKSGGYVARMPNMEGSFRWGSYVPALQVGDMVQAGMAVATIPDMQKWEVSAQIGELDRGHLGAGQQAALRIVAMPGRAFKAKVVNIGGTSGPPWDRRFACRLAIVDPVPELRAGLTAEIRITTEQRDNVLWIPSQALFESDGRAFVYVKTGPAFTPKDVKVLRKSESQVVVEGLQEGLAVALASPDQMMQKAGTDSGGAMKALAK